MAQNTDIVTLAEAKDALNITTATHDTLLAQWITAVSERVDARCGPVVIRTITDEQHDGGSSILFLRHKPVAAVSSVKEYASGVETVLSAESLTVAGDYLLNTNLGTLARRSSWTAATFATSGVLVTYTAGRYPDTASVGERWKTAVCDILRRRWARESPAWARPGNVDEGVGPLFFKTVDPVIDELLADELLPPVVG